MSSRIYLVSEEQLQNLHGSGMPPPSSGHVDRYAGELYKADHAIQQALHSNSADKTEKLHAINDAFDRYINYVSQVKGPSVSSYASVDAADGQENVVEKVIGSVSAKQQDRGRRIYSFYWLTRICKSGLYKKQSSEEKP